VVSWTTDELSAGFVSYGANAPDEHTTPHLATLATHHVVLLTDLAPGQNYTARVHANDALGHAVVSAPIPFTTAANAVPMFQEASGQVVMEAEHAHQRVDRAGGSWVQDAAIGAFSGEGYLTPLPNTGMNLNTDYVGTSPELIFNVFFSSVGTYTVWVRGLAESQLDDSVHAGLDGAAPISADRITGFSTGWAWKQKTMDGNTPATLSVTAPGFHTVHLWMREDGLRMDKILLRKSTSSTAPSNGGPTESPQILR
jgi:hypothetical protein